MYRDILIKCYDEIKSIQISIKNRIKKWEIKKWRWINLKIGSIEIWIFPDTFIAYIKVSFVSQRVYQVHAVLYKTKEFYNNVLNKS